MKALILLLLVCASVRANDLRLIGTNLYDFTHAGEKSIYRIRGEISHVFTKSIQVGIPVGVEYQRVQSPPVSSTHMDSSDMLRALAAVRMSADDKGNSHSISAGQYFSLSPSMREYFAPVNKYATVYLLNYPKDAKLSQAVDCFALPTKDKGYYDCGIRFTGDANQFPAVRVVLEDRIVTRTNSVAAVLTSATNTSVVITNQ